MRHSTMDGLTGHEGEKLERLIARGRLERSRALRKGVQAAWRWLRRQAASIGGSTHPEPKRAGC